MLSLLTARWCLDFKTKRLHQTGSERLFLPLYAAISLHWKRYTVRKAGCQQAPVQVLNYGQWPMPLQVPALPAGEGDMQAMTMGHPWYSAKAQRQGLTCVYREWFAKFMGARLETRGISWSGKEQGENHSHLEFQKLIHLDMEPVRTANGTLFLTLCLCFPIPPDTEVVFPYLLGL